MNQAAPPGEQNRKFIKDRVQLSANPCITLFEQQKVSYQELGISPSDPLLDTLEKINQQAEIIRLERKGFRTLQYVGVIQINETTIQILPKIDYDSPAENPLRSNLSSKENAEHTAARNLISMLIYANGMKVHPQTLGALKVAPGGWLDLLTQLFATELLHQIKQGYHRDYVQQEDRLPFVRGRWNIVRQLCRYPDLIEGLDVQYDELLPDTPLNRVFRLAGSQMQPLIRDQKTRNLLADLDEWLQPVQIYPYASIYLNQIQFTRLNERFKAAFDLARLFLTGHSITLLPGKQRAFVFTLDMNRLFEQFVTRLLQSNAKRILPREWQECVIETQGGKTPRYLARPVPTTAKPILQLKPDILIKSHGRPRLIIDMKNKTLPTLNAIQDIAKDDLYQMTIYATHFDCPNVLLLYPRPAHTNTTSPLVLEIEGSPIRIFIATLNLHQPLNQLDGLVDEFRGILTCIHNYAR